MTIFVLLFRLAQCSDKNTFRNLLSGVISSTRLSGKHNLHILKAQYSLFDVICIFEDLQI
jgi:hypothetical protein